MLTGIVLGVILGLIPGLHINLVSPLLSGDITKISIIIVSATIIANFFEFLKSCLFSVPDEGDEIAVNVLRKMISEGKMFYSIKLLGLGALMGSLICCIFYPLLKILIPLIYYNIRKYVVFFLMGISIHLIIRDKSPKKALIFFLLSGMLGIFSLNIDMKNPLLPLLSGIFGISSIIFVKKQRKKQMRFYAFLLEKKELIEGSLLGFFSALLLSFIPAIGPSQASIISSEFRKQKNEEVFLVSIGSINTSDVFLSLICLYTINKARLGAFNYLISDKTFLPVLMFIGLISSITGYFLLMYLSKIVSKNIDKINFNFVKFSVIFFVLLLCFCFDGIFGVLILILSTIMGIYAEKNKIIKSHGMGCLIIPTLIYFIMH